MIVKHIIKFSFIITLMVGCVTNALAVGESGAQFLKIGAGARAIALGESYISIADDPTATYWNPSGISQIEKFSLHVTQNFWLLDMSHQYVSFVAPFKFGNLAASACYSHSGTIEKYVDFEKVGEYEASDLALAITYGRSIIEDLHVGITIKGIHQVIEDEKAQAIAADLGVMYTLPFVDGLKVGGVIQNIGKEIRFISEKEPLPLITGLGVSYSRKIFLVTADLKKHNDYELKGNFGTEFNINELVYLRGGYNTAKSFSIGAGVNVWKCSIDYAIERHDELDNAHYISVDFRF